MTGSLDLQPADYVGFTGVGILLFAFLLSLLKKIAVNSFTYIALNFVGASLACMASVMIRYMPFVILEGTWALVSLVSLINLIARKKPSATSH